MSSPLITKIREKMEAERDTAAKSLMDDSAFNEANTCVWAYDKALSRLLPLIEKLEEQRNHAVFNSIEAYTPVREEIFKSRVTNRNTELLKMLEGEK